MQSDQSMVQSRWCPCPHRSGLRLRAIAWDRIVAAAAIDKECRTPTENIRIVFPKSYPDIPSVISRFLLKREEMYCVGGVPINENKILILQQLLAGVLKSLHSEHKGLKGMLANARHVFRSGLDSSIRQIRGQCQICNSLATSQPNKPLIPLSNTGLPFHHTVIDFFNLHVRKYALYTNRYTVWVEVALMSFGKAREVCDTLGM